jgi:maleate cis-trans isomerase
VLARTPAGDGQAWATGLGSEAVLLPDTALHTASGLEALEDACGKPILTANQVTVWQALRLAGHPTRQPGLGSLFA